MRSGSMQVFVKLAIVFSLLFLLVGCWDRIELNNLALITAIAFDKAEDNRIQVTAQIIIPRNQGGGGSMGAGGSGNGAARPTIIRSEQGLDIADALSKLQRKIPRKQFWGQCKIFIFSDTLAKMGIREHFDFLVRHPQMREGALLFVSKGKAADLLELYPPIETSSAEALRELVDLKIGARVTVEQFSMILKGDSQSTALPLVHILPKSKSAKPFQTIPYIFGIAIFKKGQMVGETTEKVTRGVMWINNEIKTYTVTFKMEGTNELVSLNPVKARIKLVPKIQGDEWSMTIKVKTEGDIVENGTNINPMNMELLNILDKSFEKDIRERIQLALDVVQHQLQADIFDFAKEFHRKYPKHWKKEKDRWDERFPQVQVNIEVDARILKPGLVNAPGGMPKEEVRMK